MKTLLIIIFIVIFLISLKTPKQKRYKKNRYYKNQYKNEREQMLSTLKNIFTKKPNETKIKDEIKEELKQEIMQEIQQEKQSDKKQKQYYNIQKGKKYEYKIKLIYEKRGYNVFPNGFIKGKKDGGIDLIAYKDNEVRLIQCKCWSNPPKQAIIRQFIGDCEVYVNKNENKFKNKDIFKDFITSCNEIDFGVQKYLDENKNILKYEIIKD